MLSIVVSVHNRSHHTGQFLDSLKKQTNQNFRLVIVDDGSTDDTIEIVKKYYPEAQILNGDGNLWWTGATRAGCIHVLENHPGDSHIIIANNDQVIAPDAIEKLLFFSKIYPHAIIGSVSRDPKIPEVVYDGACSINWTNFTFKQVEIEEKGIKFEGIDVLSGRFTLIPIDVFLHINFDAKRFPHYLGDLDFFQNAKKNDYALALCYESQCYDLGGKSGLRLSNSNSSISSYLQSQFSIRSPANIVYLTRFLLKHCPFTFLKYKNYFKRYINFIYALVRIFLYSISRKMFDVKHDS